MAPVDSLTSYRKSGRPQASADRVVAPRHSTPPPAAAKRSADQVGMVRTGAYSRFPALVGSLGGDANALLLQVQIDPAALADDKHSLPFLKLAHLLETAANDRACADLGMRLAAAQAALGATKALGPIGVAMRNAPTLREALQYFADHSHAYSNALRVCLDRLPNDGRMFLLIESHPAMQTRQLQAMEHALALMQHVCTTISNGRVRAPEFWFSHEARAPQPVYRNHFNATVRFAQSMNGLFFEESDLDQPLPDCDAQLYEIATSFVGQRFPAVARSLGSRVRLIITHLLAEGGCTHERVAAGLNLHPRTLQRRLRDEGESFEAIRDQVRRDVALRHLGQSNVSLVKMTEILGYSETSVLSRSCARWFSASPRQLRKEQANQSLPCAGETIS
jgi:AraC-like DNA-binding protein